MPIAYSWTEQIDTLDAGGAVIATEIKKHSITWQDADRAIYNGGQVGTEAAIAMALGTMALTVNQKADADYRIAGNKAAQIAIAPQLATIAAQTQSDVYSAEWQPDADIHAAAQAKALAPLFAGIAAAPVAPQYITGPGQAARDSKGSVLTMDAAGGVYRDARQMKGIAAAKLVVVGNAIFGLGKTVPSWWQWNGSNWGTSPITDGDPGVLA